MVEETKEIENSESPAVRLMRLSYIERIGTLLGIMIGEDISALANSATLLDHDFAYMIWGVEDENHNIIGTNVRLTQLKKGKQELENW